MALYESIFISRQDISPQDVETLGKNFAEIIKENGGKVVKQEYWGLRSLAYKIKKSGKGHYTLLGIDAPSEAVTEMERKMGLNEDVIRHMTIKVKEISKEPSPPMESAKKAA